MPSFPNRDERLQIDVPSDPWSAALLERPIGQQSDLARNGLVTHLRPTSFEALDLYNRRAMLLSAETDKGIPHDFPLLNIGLASEAALHG